MKYEIERDFELLEKKYIAEINAWGFYFKHKKSEALIFKIANDDENKTFTIAFQTLPDSHNGVAHILEHSVLNGSINFPVKSPFDTLAKGSLHTFLNAMTSRDATEYPVASLNLKDYFNLMHVYLDAVFNPLIYQEPNIFKQEGWHYELTDKEYPIIYKGVVYNEMKGSMSNPLRVLLSHILQSLFPNTALGKESGGIPSDIPTLTYQEFLNFHRTFYHPSNSIIFLYGNAPLEKELEFIHQQYLRHYTVLSPIPTLSLQQAFEQKVEKHAFYPISEELSTENQTYFASNFIIGETFTYEQYWAFILLGEVLCNQDSAPIRKALQHSKIGQNVSAYCMDLKQLVFSIILHNANPSDKDSFRSIIEETLRNELTEGINKADLHALLDNIEFQLREASDAQKGINYFARLKPGWLYDGNPFLGLEHENLLAHLRNWIEIGHFDELVKKYLLQNHHASMVTLEPQQGLEKELAENEEKQLQAYKAALSDVEIDALVEETKQLMAYQNREDSPENLAKIPTLSIDDINPIATFFDCKEKKIEDNTILHREDFTNHIFYTYFYFNLKSIPEELIPYASLLSHVLGSLDTEKYDYASLNRELNRHTGDFSSSITTYQPSHCTDSFLPYFLIKSKFFTHKSDVFFILLKEILFKNIFSTTRMEEILTQLSSELDAFSNNGYAIAQLRVASYFNELSAFGERISGLYFYTFIMKMMKDLEKNIPFIIANLKKVVSLLFTKENLICAVNCSQDDYAHYEKTLRNFVQKLPSSPPAYHEWNLKSMNKNEGIMSTANVQYVVMGYDFRKLGYAWNGKMRVLSHILSSDWLQNQIRVLGGAYGAFCAINPTGLFLLSSYHDPNLIETLSVFKQTVQFLKDFSVNKETMHRFIIGTIAKLDKPKTTKLKGEIAFRNYFTQTTKTQLQNERDEILTINNADIQHFSTLIAEIIFENYFCVYGNQKKIEENRSIFDTTFHIKQVK